MADDDIEAGNDNPDPEPYEPPRIDVLGTVNELTRGPDLGPGDFPAAGVISF